MKVQKIKIMKIDKFQKWAGIEFSTNNELLIVSSSILDQDSNKECIKLIALDISDNKKLDIISSLEIGEKHPNLTSV